MRIGIIGAGKIGATAARLFIGAGHEVALSNSRGPESLRALVTELGPKAHAMSVDDAAKFGDIVLLAVPWRAPDALPSPAAVKGKIVIDAMNSYTASGGHERFDPSTSSSEETLKRLPGARLVKAFNTIWFRHLTDRGRTDLPVGARHAIFLAGDDADAKRVVSRLIEEIGFAPVDTGSLHDGGRRQEPNTPLYNQVLTGVEGHSLASRPISA
jgi:predicted dinucleotide-binding enzyme